MGIPKLFQAGIATYEFWLKLGIVLLGARFVLADVLKLGGISLALVVIEITLSLALMTLLGSLFKLKPKLISLLAIGSAVCGVSAIIAAKGAIDADDEDSSFAIAAILALGALALFTFPAIAHSLHMNDVSYGLWAGLGVDNTAEATAAGALVFGRRRQSSSARQDRAECHDWLRCLGVRDLLGGARSGRNRQKQSRVSLEEVPEVHLGFPFDFGAGQLSTFSKGQVTTAWQSFKVGILVDVRGCWLAHEFS